MRVNDLLEEDLRTLKETDFMGPTTRAEFTRRKKAAAAASPDSEERKLDKLAESHFSSFDEILKKKKSEQLEVARSMFGAPE